MVNNNNKRAAYLHVWSRSFHSKLIFYFRLDIFLFLYLMILIDIMERTCKSCKSNELSVETWLVCMKCGDVQEELIDDLCALSGNETTREKGRVKSYEAYERLTGRIRNETNSAETRRQICRAKVLNDMRKAAKQLVKHSSALDETMNLINNTFQLYKGRLLNSKKYGLVGACIYYMSAKYQLGISLADICKSLGIKMKVISSCLKQVRQLCPDNKFARPSINDLVQRFVDELATKSYVPTSLDTGNLLGTEIEPQPLIENDDRQVLHNRIILLIDLFEAMHPYNGPAPQNMITALLYHAWKSLDTFKIIAINFRSPLDSRASANDNQIQQSNSTQTRYKHKIGFEKFCQICNFKYSPNASSIVSKIQSSLLKLGKYLGDVNKINLPFYLKDIIENSPHLIQEYKNNEGGIQI